MIKIIRKLTLTSKNQSQKIAKESSHLLSAMKENINRRWILHLDMDAFYASIEQLDHPEYRGKPVVVGADPNGGEGRGVVSTASYEAREYGIGSAMPISRAYRACPTAVFLPVRMHRYQELSAAIMAFLRNFTPAIEIASIDEAFLDLTGTERLFGDPVALARSIKGQISAKFNLTASLGLGPNKLIAKIASDLEKPDGLTIVRHDEVTTFLKNLPITRIWGVGRKTAGYLEKLGISKVGQLAEVSENFLEAKFGKYGAKLAKLARGIDDSPVVTESERKQMSKEITFAEDVEGFETIKPSFIDLCERVGFRMRLNNFLGRTIIVKVRYSDFTTITRSRTLGMTNHTKTIIDTVLELIEEVDFSRKIRLIGVGVSNLDANSPEQLDLFAEDEHELEAVIDKIRIKFGENALRRGINLW